MLFLIDAGHGGNDTGAISGQAIEKDINLQVALRVKHHLERHSQRVRMTRTNDATVELVDRTKNNKDVDICCSIHCNSYSNSLAKGLEIFTYGTGSREILLAKKVLESIKRDRLYSVDRGIKQADFHMVREIPNPSILVEMGFISNIDDRERILNNIEKFAIAIARGLLSFYEIAYKEEITPTPQPIGQMYYVQVGAYSNLDNAKAKVKELESKGIESFIKIG